MGGVKHQDFSPYTDNGGTVAAIAGKNYTVIGSDTRLSSGYNIYTRNQSKLFHLTTKTILGASGCWCDCLTLSKVLGLRIKNYQYEHNRPISTPACSQLVSNMLYQKRFFPYYVSTVVAGLDNDGVGALYSYDPVGNFQRERYCATGSSGALILPFLDNRVGLKNIQGVQPESIEIPLEEAVKIILDVFVSAGERDIYVGDQVDLRIITADGIQQQTHQLRKD